VSGRLSEDGHDQLRRKTRWLAAGFLAWALAAAAYAALRVNFERAPVVHVRWSAAVGDRSRAELEKQFALADGTFDSGRTWVYLLTSPSAANIQALVQSPAVEDTHHIDRQQFRISSSAPRRGPYIGAGPAWIPAGLRALTTALLSAGVVALGVALAPAAAPHLVSVSVAAALVALWVAYFIELREGAIDAAGFRVGDWLVSYETGFVRRGLLGSPIIRAAAALGTRPEGIVLWIQAAIYAVLFGLLFLLVRRRRPNIWFLAFLFSPAALLFPLYDEAVIGRKDVLFLVVFALYAWWMPRPDRRWTRATAFALGATTTLAHEMFFFFTPYFFVMRLLGTGRVRLQLFLPELSLFGGALVALLLVVTLGADLHADAQCAGLLARGFDKDLCTGILEYPVTTVGDSMRETAGMIRHQKYLWFYPIAAALAALPLLPLFTSLRQRVPRAAVLGALSALAFTLPLFVLVLDWGRLLNIHVVALAVVIAAFLLDDRETPGSFFGVKPAWLRIAIVLMIGLYLTGWSMRHCCDAPLRAGWFATNQYGFTDGSCAVVLRTSGDSGSASAGADSSDARPADVPHRSDCGSPARGREG
jgi:hypothetical protein